jgi:hypothetical protein
MRYLYESLDRPTRLYIKKCSHCNLKYFGKTSADDIKNYTGSGLYWSNHLRKHNSVSIHLWNSDWYYDTSICRFALKFSSINRIVESNSWANVKNENGLDGGGPGASGAKKISNKRLSEEWKETVGKRAYKSMSETKSSCEWKKSVGNQSRIKFLKTMENKWKELKQKELETKSSQKWKQTVGKKAKEKEMATKNSDEWKQTVGIEAARKCSWTKNSSEWRKTKGKAVSEKLSKKQNDPEWKRKTYRTCEHCGKGPMSAGNYNRWHGKKCKTT